MTKKKTVPVGIVAVALSTAAFAQQGPVPRGVPHLDHVFVIMMENHGYSQMMHNPNAPFINATRGRRIWPPTISQWRIPA